MRRQRRQCGGRRGDGRGIGFSNGRQVTTCRPDSMSLFYRWSKGERQCRHGYKQWRGGEAGGCL
uniref:Uncharacterized protein n=1 Tax=Arundo donax TaxID=35708 RepID=A0A0A9BYC4_ARUDO